ncbi:SRPBCC family protein [Xanthobacter sp. KR7-225]|uniref:SRPBCC family protein n=1 Tax=Xanthobacter sp. KR7-225 TaxID=3156613 RepID=UPI0032B4A8FB
MKITNRFRVPLPVSEAWIALNDIPRVAPCAPGAQLVEARADGSYVGTVAVKLGPVALTFKGTLAYKERDEANHRVVAEASGSETRARGTARAIVIFVLSPDGEGTRVDVDTDVQLAGAIAQYGRGAALIQSTAQVLMDEFAKNFAAQLSAQPVAAPRSEAAGPAPLAPAGAPPAPPPPPAPAPAISVFTLMWKSLISLIKSTFSGKDGGRA